MLNDYDRIYAGDYIKRQIAYAGTESEVFAEKAIVRIYEYSFGIAG